MGQGSAHRSVSPEDIVVALPTPPTIAVHHLTWRSDTVSDSVFVQYLMPAGVVQHGRCHALSSEGCNVICMVSCPDQFSTERSLRIVDSAPDTITLFLHLDPP